MPDIEELHKNLNAISDAVKKGDAKAVETAISEIKEDYPKMEEKESADKASRKKLAILLIGKK